MCIRDRAWTAGVLGLERVALLAPDGEGHAVRASIGLPVRADRGGDDALGALGEGPRVTVPVAHEGRTLGTLVATWPATHGPAEQAVLASLAERIGSVLAHANRMQEAHAALAGSAELLRGEVTRLSLGRVATSDRVQRARQLARILGLPPDQAAHVALSLIHI